jgi:hypothetical protein
MSTVDDYSELLAKTATEFVARHETATDMMTSEGVEDVLRNLLAYRRPLLVQQDRDRAAPYLPLGYFTELADDERLTAFLVCLELDEEIARLDINRRFKRYNVEQPLFALCPSLFDHVRKGELISAKQAHHLGRSGLVELQDGWGRLDPLLPPELLQWTQVTFPWSPLFVRLDPWFASSSQPPEPLREAAVRPARPGWWQRLTLRNREHDGGHYVLEPVEASPETTDEFWEYHLRGVRSLEVYAQRDKEGRLSMMIEELSQERTPEDLVIGRCVHLDTYETPGTDARVAPLKHLDLAINAYFGDAAKRRLATRLSYGKVEDASVRTHLLRIEQVPFASSAEFARQFFLSSTLLTKWTRDQFGPTAP